MAKSRILVVDDDEDIQIVLSDRLQMYGYEALTACDGEEALEKVKEISPDLVLLDIRLPNMNGMEVLGRIKSDYPEIPVIMITAYGTVQLAVEAIKQGAYDFIEKPFDPPDIIRIKISKALERQALVRENQYLRSELKGEYGEIIGRSQGMMEVLMTIEKVAPSDSTVLVTGESGTGKELVARALHRNSSRFSGPFIVVNCSAIQPTLLESEIFGHEKGSFTGAIARKPGKMELADGGTLFLDEIGDMAYELQAKFLRAVQEKEFERVGGTSPIKVDIRFIAATNQNLHKAIQDREFREDLFYRLNVVNIHVPPLREHKEDIPLLIRHFLQKHSAAMKRHGIQITDETAEMLSDYPWPGNIRELQNCIERAILLSDSDLIQPGHLPQEIISGVASAADSSKAFTENAKTLKAIEKAHILKILEEAEGNRTKAAEMLDISLRGLQYKLKEYMDED